MIPGFSASQWAEFLQIVKTAALNSRARMYLFGSRARGCHEKYSDVDLLIFNAEPHEVACLADLLDESQLPYVFDLVRDQNLYEPYRKQIEAEMVALDMNRRAAD